MEISKRYGLDFSSWKEKNPIAFALLFAVVSLLTLSTAHFSGFMVNMPQELTGVIVTNFVDTFYIIFSFYLAASLIAAKVSVYFLISFFRFLIILLLWPIKTEVAKPDILNRALSLTQWLLTLGSFYFIFTESYLGKVDHIMFSAWFQSVTYDKVLLILFFVTVLVFICYIGVCFFDKCINNPSRNRATTNLAISTFVGLCVFLAYSAGERRYGYLWHHNQVFIQDNNLDGKFKLFMKSGTSMLLAEQKGYFKRFIVVSPSSIIYEVKLHRKAEKVFDYYWRSRNSVGSNSAVEINKVLEEAK